MEERHDLGVAPRDDVAREGVEGGRPGAPGVHDGGDAGVDAGQVGIHPGTVDPLEPAGGVSPRVGSPPRTGGGGNPTTPAVTSLPPTSTTRAASPAAMPAAIRAIFPLPLATSRTPSRPLAPAITAPP